MTNALNVTPGIAARWWWRHTSLARQLLGGIPLPSGTSWPPAAEALPILLYSQVAWDDVWQRPQELARGLAERRPVLFCSPVQLHQVAGPLNGRWRPARTEFGGNLLVLSPLILTGEYRCAAVRRLNRAIVARSLRPFLAPKSFAAITNTPFAEELLAALAPAFTAYDIMDDFCAFSWAPREGRNQEERLLRRARFATAGTHAMLEKFRDRCPDIEFIASGVDVDKLTHPVLEPSDIIDLPRPRLLYVGTLNDRISGKLIADIAKAFPQASVVLVGPRRATFSAPKFPANVHELGLKPHDELAGYYQHCDIGLMPFEDNDAARAVNPIKTLEYLACGLPVISTYVPDVERCYVPPVVIASPGEWPARIREMLASDDAAAKAARKDFAKGRSWRAMVEAFENKLIRLERA